MAVCVLPMPIKATDDPGDHLRDCFSQPRQALERAAGHPIPLKETGSVALIGLLGLGWSASGLVFGHNAAFERFVFGALLGLAVLMPLALYLVTVNALQPPGDGPAATLKTSLAIFATALVGPSAVTLTAGVCGLALTSWVEEDWAAVLPALVAGVTWSVGLVLQVGVGHALRRNGSSLAGIGTSVVALLVTGLATALTVWILLNPPWATEQMWSPL